MDRCSLSAAALLSHVDRRTCGRCTLPRLTLPRFTLSGPLVGEQNDQTGDRLSLDELWTPRSAAVLKPLGLSAPASYGTIPVAGDRPARLGSGFLVLVMLLFGSQGLVTGFPRLAYLFLEKDLLQLTPAQATRVSALCALPWSVKPVYGLISDMVPIGGLHRVPYIIICLTLAAAALLYGSTVQLTVWSYCAMRVTVEACLAWMLVCAEALVVQRSEGLSMDQNNRIQSVVQLSGALFFTTGGVTGAFAYSQSSVGVVLLVVGLSPLAALLGLILLSPSSFETSANQSSDLAASGSSAEYLRLVGSTLTKPRYLLLSLIHISEPTRLLSISYAVFCLKKKKKTLYKM
eukprot:TRINITY_DN11594_c0_g1_i19.p1 TRINITY_DN11594_c0_g1~~TRINITY_DN11594_c0_g1_i19.p1  ORF type:complete len:347 (-),score=53.03 TRINITY_DN11594_c0_g1_i19:50-1090(-)